MKVPTALALFFVFFQACKSQDLSADMIQSLDNCATSLNVDRNKMLEINQQVHVSEDDEEIIKFVECYAQDLGVIDDQKNIIESRVLEVTETKLKLQMKNIPDGDAKAHRIASLAVEHCKGLPKEDTVGLTAIKHRNCIRGFISTPQLLN